MLCNRNMCIRIKIKRSTTKSNENKQKPKESTRGTYNVIQVGMRDAEEIVAYSVLGAAAYIEGHFESWEHYAGFVACN